MKLSGILLQKEVVDFLLDRVGDMYTMGYVNHMISNSSTRNVLHIIVSDNLALNFPICCQTTGYNGATTLVPVIFEVNTCTWCKSRYDHPNTIKPVGSQAQIISQEYHGKFKKLDSLFVQGVDGDKTGEVVGPFWDGPKRASLQTNSPYMWWMVQKGAQGLCGGSDGTNKTKYG